MRSAGFRALTCPLYAIIDAGTHGADACVDTARAVLAAGGRLIQLRMKDTPPRDVLAAAAALRTSTATAGATLIINDRVDVALASNADGVHLGAEDLPIETARRLLGPDAVIGRSTHSLDEARAAAAAGADYIGFGPMYPTTTKIVAGGPQGIDRLRAVRAEVAVPIVAIGGIDEARAPAVRAAGADAVAMIGELARATDVEATVRRILSAL
jgi:thiamine-phosphate pyrophosphorylase